MLLDAGCDREHVRVEHDVLRREADLVDEQPVRALADRDLALDRLRLALLVECHHDDARAVAVDGARLLEERLLALLEAERVDDALALHALQAGLEHRPARAVHHDRQPRDLRLGRDEVQERRHRLLAFEQVGVHVHVDEVRAATHLLERDVERLLEVAALDQPPEARRSGHVRPLADHHEVRVRPDRERLQTAEPRHARRRRDPTGRNALDGSLHLAHVVGRRAAAASDDVHEALARELGEEAARVVRLLVVAAELVRQARVRIAGEPRRRGPREILDEGPHLGRAERAVDADHERAARARSRPRTTRPSDRRDCGRCDRRR